ncbi:hypothetical protein LJC34_06030 [Oscillospiraceae bacterium OttesenSCG-928-G22]|nr:hypothetical protein [Oscillospiraceae bacterium OttesenSCG-928-G22]
MEEILSLANNDSSYEELIQTVYTRDDVEPVRWIRNGELIETDQYMRIECLRKVNDEMCYVIWQLDDGLYLMLFELTENGWMSANLWLIDKEEPLTRASFDKVVIEKSTVDDLYKLDWYGNFISFGASHVAEFRSSFHQTIDGYYTQVLYNVPQHIVTNIDHFNALEEDDELISEFLDTTKPIYRYLLPIDREAIAALAG